MKTTILLSLFFLTGFNCKAQDVAGEWNGILKEVQLKLVFHVTENEKGFTATMDSPDQGATGIPVTSAFFENSTLKMAIPNAQIEYLGVLKNDIITGTFKQGAQTFTLNLSRGTQTGKTVTRIQEPKKPYPYNTEEVDFQNNNAKITLRGTLSLPSKTGRFPAVILITGSGPQNRDEELVGHKPFLVLSDYLTRNGIAVLRYDDRGVGQSEGQFSTATTTDFTSDVKSAIDYLKTRKDIDLKNIGLIGHSEGAIIASIAASQSKDVSFIVLLAGTGLPGYKVLLQQQELIAAASGVPQEKIQKTKEINSKVFNLILTAKDNEALKIDLEKELKQSMQYVSDDQKPKNMSDEDFISLQITHLMNPWMQYFLKFDPSSVLAKVKCQVLALNGEKDLQIAPKENSLAIENALKSGGNKATTILFPNLNHLFQECKTGLPIEYGQIEQTLSPTVLVETNGWIKKHLNK